MLTRFRDIIFLRQEYGLGGVSTKLTGTAGDFGSKCDDVSTLHSTVDFRVQLHLLEKGPVC